MCEVQVSVITTFDPTNVMLISHLQICTRKKELKEKLNNCREQPEEMKGHKNVHNIPNKEKKVPLLFLIPLTRLHIRSYRNLMFRFKTKIADI